MRVLMFLLAAFVWPLTVQAETESSDYWTYQEFTKDHPQQQQLADSFAQIVRKPAVVVSDKKKMAKIAMIYPGKQASDYWWRSVSSFEARMREAKIPYEIHPFFSEPGKSKRLQETQIAEALKSDPDYLVFTLDAFRHQVIIERIMERGRPKLILQNITTPVRAWQGRQPFLYVGFDHAEGTKLLAEKFLRSFPSVKEFSLFYGTRGYVSSVRGGTFQKIVGEKANARVSDSFYLDFNREKSKKAALHVLAQADAPKFIYACSTDIALGVIDAAKELGKLDQIGVNGWGGGSQELQAILNGDLDFTVMRMNDDNGVAMADAISMDLRGQGAQVPTVYSGDMVLVERDMSPAEIEKLSQRAFRYSNHWKTKTDEVAVYGGE